jgi:alkylation response protein AidB-like acyl-CoA dehydrogenase
MLVAHADDDQLRRFMWGLGAEGWICCQMLSEPSAGSDLAAVRTRAERDGDEWVITGSKIWTSNAAQCDYGMLLARTNWDAPKHRGLTFFLVPVHQDGVDIRPLRQMTGDAQFNEVFFDGARVSDRDRLGAVDDGWAVTRTFLAHEKNSYNPASHEGGVLGRVDLDRSAGEVLARERTRKLAAAQGRGIGSVLADLVAASPLADDPTARQTRAVLHTRRQLMTYTNQRLRAGKGASDRPGWEGPASKLTVSDLTRGQRDLGLAALGAYGMLAAPDSPSEGFAHFALHTPSLSIAGGTDEIQRNSLAEKVLGLPPEPRPDPGTPFRDEPA